MARKQGNVQGVNVTQLCSTWSVGQMFPEKSSSLTKDIFCCCAVSVNLLLSGYGCAPNVHEWSLMYH